MSAKVPETLPVRDVEIDGIIDRDLTRCQNCLRIIETSAMPPLKGFSDNPFQTRNDVIVAIIALLRPLIPHFSEKKARIRLPVATGTHFDESAAQLEGFARPLWAVGALLACLPRLRTDRPDLAVEVEKITENWIEGIAVGTDPESTEYWGDVGPVDQRMVEAEIISFALLSAPEAMFHDQDENVRKNIISWLRGMNGKPMPSNNWRWFRIFANLALIKVCGVSEAEVHSEMEADFAILDSFYLKDGWSGDGPWLSSQEETAAERLYAETGRRDQVGPGRQADYYSGSFAIQFSQLLYTKFADELDPERVSKYKQQARDFGASFWRYFDSAGAAIPFGRSLTYRFACGGFFGALAVSNVSIMPASLSINSSVKGFLLRHLRWWSKHSEDIFYPDGTMNIGWLYPNMYMSEDYNSPQSVYWCLKTLIAVASNDKFWASEEQPYPEQLFKQTLVSAPKQILVNHPNGNHHFLLSPGQFVSWPMKASQAKYCKFAYSSSLAFSVPTGPLIQQIAPDNVLALSRDGAETWAVKWKCSEAKLFMLDLKTSGGTEKTIAAYVKWYPWGDCQVEINTTLIPPTDRWPDWHVRVHRVHINSRIQTLHTIEGGFAVSGRSAKDGTNLATLNEKDYQAREGVLQDSSSALIMSESGLSGIATILSGSESSGQSCYALKPDSNTNLACQRTLIPIAAHDFAKGFETGEEFILVTKVFAISNKANGERKLSGNPIDRWLDQPMLLFPNTAADNMGDRIVLSSP